MSDWLEAEVSSADAADLMGDTVSDWLEAEAFSSAGAAGDTTSDRLEADASSSAGAANLIGFLNCTKIMVMLSHPSPPAVDGAKHRLSTLSHIVESLFSCTIK